MIYCSANIGSSRFRSTMTVLALTHWRKVDFNAPDVSEMLPSINWMISVFTCSRYGTGDAALHCTTSHSPDFIEYFCRWRISRLILSFISRSSVMVWIPLRKNAEKWPNTGKSSLVRPKTP